MGKFLETKEHERIRMYWRLSDWPSKAKKSEGEEFDFEDPGNASSLVELNLRPYSDGGTGTIVSVS